MRVLALLSFFIFNIYAVDNLVEIYRQGGIKEVEKILMSKLQDKAYWLSNLDGIDTKFGFYENIQYLLFCNKNSKLFYLYEYKDNKFLEISNINAYTGLMGDKEKEGDLKTPIGVYDLINKKLDVDEFYGPLALVTSYPNTFDRVQGKNGYGIWIHGLPLKSERPENTQGCIALDNEYLSSLGDKIDLDKSLLVTTESGHLFDVTKDDLANILSSLYSWKSSWELNDLNHYLSFYDENFKRYDGIELKEFKDYKRRIFSKDEDKTIEFSNINITPYPNKDSEKIYRVTFFENYNTRSYQFKGSKELYVKLNGEKFSILVEK
jgi:murein L,D-transpeptidase YafK